MSLIQPPPLPGASRNNWAIGQNIEGEGIYAGLCSPSDRSCFNFGKWFEVYAFPWDLGVDAGSRLLENYDGAVNYVRGLRDRYGHDGADFASDTDVYNAIRKGHYTELEKWFIPTDSILTQNVYRHRDERAFAGTFAHEYKDPVFSRYYWTCTGSSEFPPLVWVLKLSGGGYWGHKEVNKFSIRPVRLKLCKQS